MNYLIPVYKVIPDKEIIHFYKEQLDNILDQQIISSQLSSGFTYQDTEKMENYEKTYILQKLLQLKKEEVEAKQKALDNIKNKNKY